MKEKTNGFGLTSLILGICGFVIFPLLFGILAIIFGGIGLGKNEKYALTGLLFGITELLWVAINLILFLSMFM